eukprot:COSAG05_NODE_3278_length_2183_cov_1.496161_2_plen_415_part_01
MVDASVSGNPLSCGGQSTAHVLAAGGETSQLFGLIGDRAIARYTDGQQIGGEIAVLLGEHFLLSGDIDMWTDTTLSTSLNLLNTNDYFLVNTFKLAAEVTGAPSPSCPAQYATKAAVPPSIDLPTVCCDKGRLTPGGICPIDIDLYLLQDQTESFADDRQIIKNSASTILSTLAAPVDSLRFGVGGFADKPMYYFGAGNAFCHRSRASLSSNLTISELALKSAQSVGGGDGPDSQLEALLDIAKDPGNLGFESTSFRGVLLTTASPFHEAGDCKPLGLPANSGGGTSEFLTQDYPGINQVKYALELAGITPLFLVTREATKIYTKLVADLGRGDVVPLSRNSDNLLDAILQSLGQQVCVDGNDCASNPCSNGGTCIDGVNSAFCECTGGGPAVNSAALERAVEAATRKDGFPPGP